MFTKIDRILTKIDFAGALTADEALNLGPFNTWPDHAKGPWWWTGWTEQACVSRNQYRRVKARVQFKNRVVSPARVLYHFYTGIEPPSGNAFHYAIRNQLHGATKDDVNPFRYTISHQPAKEPDRPYGPRPVQPNKGLIWHMFVRQIWPKTVEELLHHFPDAALLPNEELLATIRETMK